MIRNLKALSLAFFATFAMGAMAASSSSATDFFTTAGGGPAYLTGTSHNALFTIPGDNSLACTTSKFTGTVVNGASTATLLASYSGQLYVTPHETPCDTAVGPMTFDMNDCHYKLTGNTTGSDNGTDATTWIVCPLGKEIEITGPFGCKTKIPPQTPTMGGVTYTNVPNHPGGAAITVTTTVTGLTYTSNCYRFAPHGDDLIFTSWVTLTGYTDNPNNSTTDLTTPTEGPQVGISVS
jgi:hypothetical protein